jgi:hypothetical protein
VDEGIDFPGIFLVDALRHFSYTFQHYLNMKAFRLLVPVFTLASALSVHASYSYGVAGSTYTETFDSLPTSPENASLQSTKPWTDDVVPTSSQSSILGWYLYHPTASATEGGANQHQRLRASSVPGNTGAFYSFGNSSSSTERALGDIGANTLAPDGQTGNDAGNLYIALRLFNNTGLTLDTITVGYTGEQWRDSGTSTAETMTLAYSTAATASSADATFFGYSSNMTDVASLAWTSPKATATAAALDGNNAANQVVVGPVVISGLNWAPGTDLWLRWTDPQLSGKADQGMAIDNFNFSAVATPEPSAMALIGFGLAGLLISRRRK